MFWNSSIDGVGDSPECSTTNRMDLMLNEEEIREINYDYVE